MTCDTTYDEVGNELVPLDSIASSVLIRVPALPYDLVLSQLRIKFGEFARRTGCIRMSLPIPIQAGVNRYPLPVPEGYHLFSVRHVYFGEHGRVDAPSYWRGWNGVFAGYSYHLDESDAFVLRQAPTRDNAFPLRVSVQLVPRVDVDTIPADIADIYGDAIGAGVAGEAMNNRQKPWYDPGNSVRVSRLFHQAINDARANTERGKEGAAYMRTSRWV
jgi:hypothetical protein